MAGFNLSRKNPTDKKRPDEFCLRMSDKLRKFVKSMNWFPVSRTPKKWSDEVRKLRDDIKKSYGDKFTIYSAEEQIERTLDKYIALGKKIPPGVTVPRCKDWKQLRAHWQWVTDVIAKCDRDNPTVKVSDKAKLIARVLSRLGWPGSARDKLPQAVQVSLDNMDEFHARLNRVLANEEIDKFIRRAVFPKLLNPDSFIEQWFTDVHNRIKDWEAWNGNIMTEVFRPESKHFHKWGKKVSTDWSGSSDLWFKLCERLKING